ncbi:hypothetical protein RHMOL_Rhmol12G0001200 [Rhododendron molle]|nr:hypothetical protein RHMOL_Rhmol12G0001200 [Rhododendron molle]
MAGGGGGMGTSGTLNGERGENNSFSSLNSIDTRERDSDDSRIELIDAVQDNQEQKEGEGEGDEDDNDEFEDETDEEEDGDGDGAYAFRFDGEMDPLAFTEDDTFGVQPYQQFERLEHAYEALAEKKRNSLSQPHPDPRESPVKKSRQEGFNGAIMEEIMEVMNYGRRKRSKKSRKRGRRKGSKNKGNPEVTRKLGDATLHYAHGRYEEVRVHVELQNNVVRSPRAICALKEVIRVAPNLPDPYHTLGIIYSEIGDKKKALNFYMLAAHLTPKDSSLWKLLVPWSIEQGNAGQARYCLSKAITADPADMSLRFSRASLYVELGEYQKAAESYEQISRLCPENLEALKTATMSIFSVLQRENVYEHPHLAREVADSLMALGHYKYALKYYMMLEGIGEDGGLHLRIAQCYLSVNDRGRAIKYLYTALRVMEDSVDARLTLASLLLDEDKQDEAISILSPCKSTDSKLGLNSDKTKPWWLNGKIKLELSRIYKTKGMTEAFVDAIFPSVRESLFLETIQQKVRAKKSLPKSVLSERVKLLDAHHTGDVFQGFRPVASTSDLSKASRAKKLLQKKAMVKEAKKAAAMAAGLDWKSDNSDEDSPQAMRDPPLPNLLKDEEHHHLIIDLCKSLASLKRYWEAIEVINLTLKLASNTLSVEKGEELRSLGAQIAYNITDPSHGWDYARHVVNQNPYSFATWNCYYKVVSRLENRYSKHNKLLHGMRVKHKDSIPPIIISGHQLSMISQHQAAAREYLEAYKLMPDSPLVNLCVGTALINLALGLRLQNKHRCLLQGLAFLYNNLRLCESSQEALYNIARAYHHLGLVTLAASYYEKVLAIHEKDYPIPKLPNENPVGMDNRNKNYCDLGREAAYNLHLIYKTSGALDLARQV